MYVCVRLLTMYSCPRKNSSVLSSVYGDGANNLVVQEGSGPLISSSVNGEFPEGN